MRIDVLLFNKKVFSSRNKAKESIARGEIFYDGSMVNKPSFEVPIDSFDKISVKRVSSDFVSIGGFKLEKALDSFDFSVHGLICADVGASTGGFTDCLLQRGAKKVYAVDLNDTLLSDKLKENDKVVSVIKNARYLTKNDFKDKIDLIVSDVSFISETLLLNVFSKISDRALILIKPQFEDELKIKRKNGIINDEKTTKKAVLKIIDCAINNGFYPINIINAPIIEGKNKEYLLLLEKKEIIDFCADNFLSKLTF